MSVFEKLKSASFRGIPFLMESESKQGGPRNIIHEYPDSTKRYVESIGEIPPTFNINCIIHGDDAINKRLAFEKALNEQSIGTLEHPIYGVLQVKVIAPYAVKSTQRSLGQFSFNVNFATTEEFITPSAEAVDTGQVSADTANVTDTLNTALEEGYKDPSFADSLNSAAEKITAITQSINRQLTKVVEPIQKNVAAFNRVVNSVQTGALTIVSQGNILKDTITELYNGFNDIVNFPQDLLSSWQELTDFNLFAESPQMNTIKQAETGSNERNLDSHTRLTCLAYSFEAFAYTDFQTDIDIDNARIFIDEKYSQLLLETGANLDEGTVVDPETGDEKSGDIPIPAIEETSSSYYVGYNDITLNQDVRSAFETLRTNTLKILDEKEQNVFRIRNIDIYKSSLALISYRYYGGLNNLSILQELNPKKNHSFINGTLKVIAQ